MQNDFKNLIYTGRGSSALYAILKSLDFTKKNILLPVNICEIVYPIVIKAGFTPIFYDVNETDGNGRLETIQAKYSGNETVLLAAHNFGAPMKIDVISNWAKANNIFLIEDVCNSIGACYQNKLLGTWGDAAIFSFGYVKIIEYGIGGAALIKEKKLTKKVEALVDSFANYAPIHKEKNDYFQSKIREVRQQNPTDKVKIYSDLYKEYSNYLLYKIEKTDKENIANELNSLEENLKERNKKALRYRKEITSTKVQHIPEVSGQIYWRYNLLVDSNSREKLIGELRENNTLVSTWYPPIIDFFVSDFNAADYSGSYLFSKKVINLFVDHRVSESDISKTIEVINNF